MEIDSLQDRIYALEVVLGFATPDLKKVSEGRPSLSQEETAATDSTATTSNGLGVRIDATPGVEPKHTPRILAVASELQAKGVPAVLRWVPEDYYQQPLEYRRQCLEGSSVDHLCKTIMMENTRAHESVDGCSNPLNSRYYLVVVQYSARFHNEKMINYVYKELSKQQIPKKYFNMRLAPENVCLELTGYENGAVVPVALNHPIPIILSHKILELQPDFFWLGGGEVLVKLGLRGPHFVEAYKPFVADVTY